MQYVIAIGFGLGFGAVVFWVIQNAGEGSGIKAKRRGLK